MGNPTRPSPTFPQYPGGAFAIGSSGQNAKSDTINFSNPSNAAVPITAVVYVGGAGNVQVQTAQNETVLFSGLNAGTVIPVQVVRVFSSNTTATNLVGIY
jgi:hypothetical protein